MERKQNQHLDQQSFQNGIHTSWYSSHGAVKQSFYRCFAVFEKNVGGFAPDIVAYRIALSGPYDA